MSTAAKNTSILVGLGNDSQLRTLMYHLMTEGSITQKDAIAYYSIYRLAARIADLRDAGAEIRTEKVQNQGRGYHAKYILEGVRA